MADEPRTWARRDRSAPLPAARLYARKMRAEPTRAETKLWRALRAHQWPAGVHFRRQVQIGRYIVDFLSHRARLIIEVDGAQHATAARDTSRTEFLRSEGYRALRFWNNEALEHIEGCMTTIAAAISTSLPPTPDPSPQGGGERRRRARLTR